MGLYVILIILFVIACFEKKRKTKELYFLLCCAILLFLACFRAASVGVDHADYIDVSLGRAYRFEEKVGVEIVWGWINSVLSKLQVRPLFTITTSLLMLVPLFMFIKKESSNKVFSLLLFLLIPTGYCFFLTGIRQSIATAFLLWSFYFVVNKRYVYALIPFILVAGIHASVFFVILFLPLIFINVKEKILYALLVVSALTGFLYRLSIFDVFSFITPYVGHLSYYEGYGSYHADEMMNLNGLISVIVPSTIFAIVAIKYGSCKDLYLKLYCCGVIGTNFFANVPMIGRYFMYFTILQIILIPNIFPRCSRIAKVGIILTISYMVLLFLLYIPSSTGTDQYKFFF
jgi:transmembrane protein EpsG